MHTVHNVHAIYVSCSVVHTGACNCMSMHTYVYTMRVYMQRAIVMLGKHTSQFLIVMSFRWITFTMVHSELLFLPDARQLADSALNLKKIDVCLHKFFSIIL